MNLDFFLKKIVIVNLFHFEFILPNCAKKKLIKTLRFFKNANCTKTIYSKPLRFIYLNFELYQKIYPKTFLVYYFKNSNCIKKFTQNDKFLIF